LHNGCAGYLRILSVEYANPWAFVHVAGDLLRDRVGLTVIFTFWRARSPNIILMILLLDAIVLTAIAGSTAAMAIYILYLNRFRGKASDEVH
jgi:hypothetical protein